MSPALVGSALVLGALGSPHCVAMCGGIAGALCGALPAEVRGRGERAIVFTLAYNAGRIASYAGAGFVAGTLGTMAGALFPASPLPWIFRALAGVLLVGAGLFVAGLGARFAKLEVLGAPVWRIVSPYARKLLPVRSAPGAVTLGLLWGWMPCGLVYSALALAFTAGSGAEGAAVMAAFGLGTLPALVGASLLASVIARGAKQAAFRRAAGIALVAFGCINLAAGALPGRATDGSEHCGPRSGQ